jgi:predicted  nucleic acid-binding Zn-ribbon protein
MFLETVTFLMLALVLALKYGTVTRIVQLSQRLRDAEAKCRRSEEKLKAQRGERRVAEREETALTRQEIGLEEEIKRVEGELNALKESNLEVLQHLSKDRRFPDMEKSKN